MAKPSNMGTYNQGLEYPDQNVFQVAFDEARDKAKNLAEEAYDKKKEKYLKDFFNNLRTDIMMPADAEAWVIDEDTGEHRLNKGFFDISNITEEQILAKARKGAEEAGLSYNSIDDDDILNPRLESLYNEAAKRQYTKLLPYYDEFGDEKFKDLLRKDGRNWMKFHRQFGDPWAEVAPGDFDMDDIMIQGGNQDTRSRDTKTWRTKQEALGWTFNHKGQVVGVPGMVDPSNPVDVRWDDQGAYVNLSEAGSMTGFLSWDTINPFRGQAFLDHWGGKTKKYIK